jgi:hypothetical protein
MKTFRIKIPSGNEKKAPVFSQLLQNLHETLDKEVVSFEIIAEQQHISFCFSVEDKTASLIEGQVYSLFPACEIEEIPDVFEEKNFLAGEVHLKKTDLFPIKIFSEFEGDSLSGILSVLSKADIDEKIVLQFVIKPKVDSGWLHFWRGIKRKIENFRYVFRVKYWFKKGDFRKTFSDAFAKKEEERLFSTNIRFVVFSENPVKRQSRFSVVANSFFQYNTIDLNRFLIKKVPRLKEFVSRSITRSALLSQSEIATLFHLPNEREVPNLVYVLSQKSDPPAGLPTENKNRDISFFGETNFHNSFIPFGILKEDRRRHLYCIGKSGSGKSKFLELLIKNDLENGRGIGVLDPHGDLVDNVLKMIPKNRIQDVVIFDPADESFPIAFNPLEKVPSSLKMRVTIGFLEIFKKLFGTNWTERLEHVLRYTVLALLDSPNTTVLSILKMLSDKNYRQYIVRNIEDDVVKNFWVNEFAGWSEKFDAEAITPLLNKVGQFVATNMIRNIVGQPVNKIHFREIMDNGKILLMKVSKGMLGEENAGLMGAFAVTKIYQAAMSRADTPEHQRKDFYFYVDEFHNFATDTFDEILSEARKYRLNLTLAHQFMGQLSPRIQKTIFGNVGSILSFRVGSEDAGILSKEYAPIFSPKDIINLGIREFYAKISIRGEITQAFSGRTLSIDFPKDNYFQDCIDFSRQNYCRPVQEVKKIIASWEEGIKISENTPAKNTEKKSFEEPVFETPVL